MRYRLRVLLIPLLSWALAVAGALGGMFLANSRISDGWLPSQANLVFAVAWGVVFGIIPTFGMAAYVVDNGSRLGTMWVWVVCSAIAAVSGFSLYYFAVSTAAV